MVDTLEDIILRHQVYLQRLVPQLGAEQIKMIDKNNPELRGELIQFLEDNEFYKLTKEQQNKLAVFRNKVYKLRGGAIDEAGAKYQGDMLNLAEREQVWFANGVEDLGGKSLAVSSSSALAKMVERQPFVGKTLNQIYSKLSVDDTDRVMTSVSDGLNSGLTKQQIQNQIFGTKKLGYTDGVLQQTRNYINNNNTNSGVVRTTVNGVSNESKRLLYEANSDIIDKVQYMATLDGRTSNICASRDGKIYKQGNEPPLPAHISCRSTYVPIIDGLDIESTRPYVADTRTRKEREKDFREQAKANGTTIKQERDKWKDKAIGQVSDKTTYQQWFDKQPASFQKEKLGKTKYELYKKGGMKFDRFQDPLNKSYTIDELYKLDKNAFKKAGLGKGGAVLPKPKKESFKAKHKDITEFDLFKQANKNPSDFEEYVFDLRRSNRDIALEKLAKEQGFTKKPQLVDKTAFKALEKDHKIVYRGVTENKYKEQFKDGEYFGGIGRLGNGTYTAFGEGSKQRATAYGESVLSIAVPKNAKLLDIKDVGTVFKKEYDKIKDVAGSDGLGMLISDVGRMATSAGYDGIISGKDNELIILNRGLIKVLND